MGKVDINLIAAIITQYTNRIRPKKILCLWLHDPSPPPQKKGRSLDFFFFQFSFLLIARYSNKIRSGNT